MASELDSPFHLARALAPLVLRHERRSLGRAEAQALPSVSPIELRQRFPGGRHVEFASGLPASDPLRAPLCRWAARLTELRVNAPWQLEDERLAREALHVVTRPQEARVSIDQLLEEARSSMLELGGGEARSRRHDFAGWRYEQVSEKGAALSEHRRGHATRVEEVRVRLGLTLADTEFGIGDTDESTEVSMAALTSRALGSCKEWVLRDGLSLDPWRNLLQDTTGEGLVEGWPSRLAPDALRKMLALPVLSRGVNLADFRLPVRWCPASFGRAVERWGRALRQSIAPGDLPAVAVRHPDDFDGRLWGQLLASWLWSEPFARRVRGRSPAQCAEERRHRARMLAAHLCVSALRAHLQERLLTRSLLREPYQELTAGLFGEPRPWSAVLVELSVSRSERARFCAFLSAPARIERLVEEFDEDWLDNPRAQEKLREDARRPATSSASRGELERGLELLLGTIRRDMA